MDILAPLMSLYTRACELTPLPQSVVSTYSWMYDAMGAEKHPSRYIGLHAIGQHLFLFWTLALPLLALDVYRKPAFLYKFKMQARVPSSEQLWHCARQVVLNQFLVLLPLVFGLYPLYVWRGCPISPEQLPSMAEIFVDLLICTAVEEVLFYYSHRALHSRLLYGPVHKQHHQFQAPGLCRFAQV